ncbi:MAG TPA: hypothetical protein VHT75_04310 [Acidimicrobiales bacterium]|jgi:hypothetical protein|nr:hypothetical protein [Acidimicrobiales bacterium]
MHRGHRVIAWVPFGRERTVSILIPYLLRDVQAGLIDEIWLCMNTSLQPDIDYAHELEAQHDAIRCVPCPGPDTPELDIPAEWRAGYRQPVQLNTGRFPLHMQDRNTIYVRFDDDIVWVHPDTVRTLADRVLDRRYDTIAVFPLIWNNSISSWMAQRHGRLPLDWGKVAARARTSEEVSAVDPVGWQDPVFAERVHGHLLSYLEAGAEDSLLLPAELQLGRRQQFSVSCFAIHGSEYADLNGFLSWDEEEHWLTMHHPGIVNRDNRVCGMAQVAHFSFYTQRDYLLERTDILDRYRALADRVTAGLYYSGLAAQQSMDGATAA